MLDLHQRKKRLGYRKRRFLRYHTIGRNATDQATISGRTYTTTSEYNARGELTRLTYPDGSIAERTYHDTGALHLLRLDGSTISTRTYDDGRRLTGETLGNGVTETRTYSTDNLLTGISYGGTGTSIGNLSYTWDANKNKTSETIGGTMSGYGFTSAGTTYDDEDRLTGYATCGMGVPPMIKNQTHEILTADGKSLETDPKGMSTVLSSSLTPQASRLLPVARTGTGGSVVYVQHDQQTIADYPVGGVATAPTNRYVYASYIDEPVVRKAAGTSGTIHYYHRNQQYSITAMTTSTGAVAERYAYTAYGQPMICNASGSPIGNQQSQIANRFTYTGREWDETLGLHHFRARWMSPMAGRFLGRDTIGYEGSQWGLYEFFESQALNQVDPTGHSSIPPANSKPASVGYSICGKSVTAPYIDPVDLKGDNWSVDNKEVIGSLFASASVNAIDRPAMCGKNTYLHVVFSGNHTKKFSDLRASKVHQQDFADTACSHTSSTGFNWVTADWYCPLQCKDNKCVNYTFASIVFLTQGQPPGMIYYTRPGQMIAIEAKVNFGGDCCQFGCNVEITMCQLMGYGIPNTADPKVPPPSKLPSLGAAARGACVRWNAPHGK